MTSLEPRSARTSGGWGAPAREQKRGRLDGRGRIVVLGTVLAVVAGAVAISLALVDGGHAGGRHAVAPAPDPVRATVDSMSSIVARSAADRSRVISAIDGVQSCDLPATQGQAVVESVISDRRAAVAQLERLAAARPSQASAPLVNELLTTLNASISDDVSYMSWMGDVAGGHAKCAANPMADPNFAAAKAQSDRTDADKQAFVDSWNPLAAKYGKPAYQAQDF